MVVEDDDDIVEVGTDQDSLKSWNPREKEQIHPPFHLMPLEARGVGGGEPYEAGLQEDMVT